MTSIIFCISFADNYQSNGLHWQVYVHPFLHFEISIWLYGYSTSSYAKFIESANVDLRTFWRAQDILASYAYHLKLSFPVLAGGNGKAPSERKKIITVINAYQWQQFFIFSFIKLIHITFSYYVEYIFPYKFMGEAFS